MGNEVTLVLLSRMGSDIIITGEQVIKAVSPSSSVSCFNYGFISCPRTQLHQNAEGIRWL